VQTRDLEIKLLDGASYCHLVNEDLGIVKNDTPFSLLFCFELIARQPIMSHRFLLVAILAA